MDRRTYPQRVGSGIRPAINGQIRPSDIRGFRTGNKRHQGGDLLNTPIPVERCGSLLGHRPIARSRIQIGVDGTWLDVVDRDTPDSNLSGQALGKLFTAPLVAE